MLSTFQSWLALTLIGLVSTVNAQLCTQDNRYVAATYFSDTDIEVVKDMTYRKVKEGQSEVEELQLDLYFPKLTKDTLTKRPLILFIHGGGFVNGNRGYMTKFCEEFSKRGYVAATMSYRLGFDQSIPGDNLKAVYKAQQDALAALEFITEHAEKYHIDPNWVFIGGSSAGAITSFLTAYGSQEEWNAAFSHLEPLLGPLTENKTNATYRIRGIFNQVGCASPIVLNEQQLLPTISFHGDQDTTVPIDQSYMGLGSRALHKLMDEKEVCNDITIVPEGGHDVYQSEKGTEFIIRRTACFFKSILCDTCISFSATKDIEPNCLK